MWLLEGHMSQPEITVDFQLDGILAPIEDEAPLGIDSLGSDFGSFTISQYPISVLPSAAISNIQAAHPANIQYQLFFVCAFFPALRLGIPSEIQSLSLRTPYVTPYVT